MNTVVVLGWTTKVLIGYILQGREAAKSGREWKLVIPDLI